MGNIERARILNTLFACLIQAKQIKGSFNRVAK